jgi:hypothetical protein
MVEPSQLEIDCNYDDEYQTQGLRHVKLFTGNQESLSENFTAEIDAWARQAMAANGFGDY